MKLSKNICIDRDTLTHFIGVILDETIFHEISQQKHFIGVVAPKTIDYYNFTQTSTNIETCNCTRCYSVQRNSNNIILLTNIYSEKRLRFSIVPTFLLKIIHLHEIKYMIRLKFN